MDLFLLAMLGTIAFVISRSVWQKKRMALLAAHLSQFRIEKLMETLTSGYLRALGEPTDNRRGQIFALLDDNEAALAGQFARFAEAFAKVDAQLTRVSTLPVALPWADRLVPGAGFDLREALRIHARGITETALNQAGASHRDKAFRMSAELFLMQHTCHWFCRSKAVASARMQMRHGTSHAQLVASVSPQTRAAYQRLTEG